MEPDAISGSVTPLLSLDFGKQLVDRLRVVDPDEAAEEAPSLPPHGPYGHIRKLLCTVRVESHVPVRLRVRHSSDVARDVRVGQVGEQLHD